MIRARVSRWWAWYNRAIETRTGRDLSAIAIVVGLIGTGSSIYSNWPGTKPATLLYARAEAEWRGNTVMITLHWSVDKRREDCRYTSDRIIERLDEHGFPKRFLIPGAQASAVRAGDTSEQETNFFVPGDLMPPDDDYVIRVRGTYSCPNANFPADPVEAKFTLPAKPVGLQSRAGR